MPVVIGRHSHPQVPRQIDPASPTGIDYRAVIERQHRRAIGEPIGYAGLDAADEEKQAR